MTTTVAAQAAPSDGAFRRRLLDGLAASIDERGYRDSTVADIVRHARTSKRTFYDQFSTKEECFAELLTANAEEIVARSAERSTRTRPGAIRSVRPSPPTWPPSRREPRSR